MKKKEKMLRRGRKRETQSVLTMFFFSSASSDVTFFYLICELQLVAFSQRGQCTYPRSRCWAPQNLHLFNTNNSLYLSWIINSSWSTMYNQHNLVIQRELHWIVNYGQHFITQLIIFYHDHLVHNKSQLIERKVQLRTSNDTDCNHRNKYGNEWELIDRWIQRYESSKNVHWINFKLIGIDKKNTQPMLLKLHYRLTRGSVRFRSPPQAFE